MNLPPQTTNNPIVYRDCQPLAKLRKSPGKYVTPGPAFVASFWKVLIALQAVKASVATFIGLGPGISYHFYVRACNAVQRVLGPIGKTPDGSDTPAHPRT